jgi:Tol biopolymer transport system component
MPFLPATATFTSTPTLLPTITPTLEPTLTSTSTPVPPTASFTPTVTPRPIFSETPLPVIAAGTDLPAETSIPDVTPTGGGYGQIAFVSDRSGIPQLYLTGLLGEAATPITKLPGGACQPSWSPDGSMLVFVSPCKNPILIGQTPPTDTSLYTIRADGSELTQITSIPLGNFEPAWSPDGARIAFTSVRDGNMQIYSINLADQSVTRLTNLNPGVEARQASWSPFGNQIAFAVKRLDAYQVWAMLDNGENALQIIRSGPTLWDYMPIWTKDGVAILFSQQKADEFSLPWQMSVLYEKRGSTASTRMEFGPLPVEHLDFSSDGFWVVFQGREVDGTALDIYLMTAAGADRVRLTTDPGNDFDPAWRPAP